MITIGITCYNAAETIGRALRSALGQDWPDFEIIIADDASTDQSVAAARAAAAGDVRVKILTHAHNQGVAAMRNAILSASSGDVIVFFDDDDESLPLRLRMQYEALCSYEQKSGADLCACYAGSVRIYPNGYCKIINPVGGADIVPRGPAMADYILFFSRMRGWCYGGTGGGMLMARRAVFAALDGFDPSFRRAEDLDFAVRLALAGGHFVGAPGILFHQYATSAPDKSPDKNLRNEQALINKHADYLKAKGVYYYAFHWPLLRYYHFTRRYVRFMLVLAGLMMRYPLRASRHFLCTASARFMHERKMKAGQE